MVIYHVQTDIMNSCEQVAIKRSIAFVELLHGGAVTGAPESSAVIRFAGSKTTDQEEVMEALWSVQAQENRRPPVNQI